MIEINLEPTELGIEVTRHQWLRWGVSDDRGVGGGEGGICDTVSAVHFKKTCLKIAIEEIATFKAGIGVGVLN